MLYWFQPDIDSIVSKFQKTLDKLNRAYDFHTVKNAEHFALACKHDAEQKRAAKLAKKFEDLLK
jgi:hypothetical protein